MVAWDRFNRQTILPEVGHAGQGRLWDTSVLLVGAGGLGCPAALYLIAAGIGQLTIVDPDVVDLTNLQRQVAYSTADVGLPKALQLTRHLQALHPEAHITGHVERFDARNAARFLHDADIVIDGTDNFSSHFLIGDAAWLADVPLISASVQRFHGHIAAFAPGRSACHRCLFAEPPPLERSPNCADAGVLGVMPGMMGVMQATWALMGILGIGESPWGRITSFDALLHRFQSIHITPDPHCMLCGADPHIRNAVAMDATCASVPMSQWVPLDRMRKTTCWQCTSC